MAAAVALALALLGAPGCAEQGGGAREVAGDQRDSATTTLASTTTTTAPEPGATVGTQPATLDALPDEGGPAPVRLRIGDLGVDAAVVPVGVEPDGDMEVPPADQVGWYRFGPGPGEQGSAVLAGHVDFDGRAGVFFRLADLAPGTAVTVDFADGTSQAFQVDGIGQVAKADLAASGVFDRVGPPRLALVTCGGEFDRAVRSYRDNVVVTAVPEA